MKNTLKILALGTLVTITLMTIFFATNIMDQKTGLHTNDTVRMTIMLAAGTLGGIYSIKKSKTIKA